ncbi:titin [Cimex lectularius]|uniref:Titin n=1 Tax=Cimex lectularius TaxID=79782 RepID=A0A8I6SPZ9_CIMLE|nr:titin [Cimex lectularius]
MGSGGSKHKPQGSRAHPQHPEKPSPPGKPYLIPGTPSDPDVVTIRWEQPIFNGGSKITGYLVEHKRTGSPHWVKATPLMVRHTQLSLSGLEPGMRYQFRVWAENAFGRSDHSELSEPLAISYGRSGVSIAPVFSRSLNDIVAIENEMVEFLVRVEGTPLPKISWYKDGFEVFSNRRQKVSTDCDISSFIIHQAALSDEGEIKCSATNKAGHAVTKARLTLEAPPSIRLPRQYEDGLLFELGEMMRLKVLVTGRPLPSVTWLHNGEEVKTSSRLDLATTDRYAMLRVTEATREDRGEYQVKAKNKIGDDIASFLVTITDRPLPPGKVNVVMTLGRCVTLAWTAPHDDGGCKIGNYIVEYYRIGWNMWLKAATCRQLTTTIGDLIEGSEYKFRVKAENPYGISDPSPDSDTVFIPDPKRGLLEPPPKGTKAHVDDMPDQWLKTRKSQIEKNPQVTMPRKIQDFEWDEDESLLPSPVILANQVLRKVKMAPKRTWSEDSQGSPPREPSPKPAPIPPKRKHRPTNQPEAPKRIHKISEESQPEWNRSFSPGDDLHSSSEMMLVLVGNSRAETEERDLEPRLTAQELKDGTYVAPPMSLSAPVIGVCDPISSHSLRPWGSSSDLMYELTLARFNKEVDEEEIESKVKRRYGVERKRSFEQKRHSKTREEILSELKEKTTSLENIQEQENMAEIRDASPLRKISNASDIDDERGKRNYDQFSERFMMLEKSFQDYTSKYEIEEGPISDLDSMGRSFDYTEDEVEEEPYHPRLGKGTFTPITIDMPKSEEVRSKFQGNLSPIVIPNDKKSPSPGPVPAITLNDHPQNVNDEVKTEKQEIISAMGSPSPKKKIETNEIQRSPSPKVVKDRSRERKERSPSPKQRYSMPYKLEDESRERSLSPKHRYTMPPENELEQRHIRDVRSRTPSPQQINPPKILIAMPQPTTPNTLTEPVVLRKRSPSPKAPVETTQHPLSKLPKPILKVRDQSLDRSELSDSELGHSKKVRIEVPQDKQNIDRFATEENDIGLHAGEVARNRRRQVKSQNFEDQDDTKVVVSHYSDIVREFGHPKKPVPKLYLSYEELKAAADKIQEEMSTPAIFDKMEKQTIQEQKKQKEEAEKKEKAEEKEVPNENELNLVQVPRKKNLLLSYMLDLFLFLIACWLYIFHDPKLVIPLLLLMIYRQLSDSLHGKLSFGWGKKKE